MSETSENLRYERGKTSLQRWFQLNFDQNRAILDTPKFLKISALPLDLGAPKTTICPLNMQISLIVASIFLSMLFMVQFRCDLNMMLLCVSAIIGCLLRGRLLRSHLLNQHLLRGRLSRQCLSRGLPKGCHIQCQNQCQWQLSSMQWSPCYINFQSKILHL